MKRGVNMRFEKMEWSDVLRINTDLVAFTVLISMFIVVLGIVLLSKDKGSRDKRGYLLIFGGIAMSVVLICTMIASNNSKELMNGETTTEIQSVYHIDDNKITKVNINGHMVKFKGDNELKKGDHIRIKAKNVQIDEDKFIQRTRSHEESFEYEKIN